MTDELERRYRRLLRFYPATYRRERADEIIDTLLQGAQPGQRRPGFRDTIALATGGLRARAGVDRRLSLAANLQTSVLFTVFMLLAYPAAIGILQAYDEVRLWIHYGANQQPSGPDRQDMVLTALTLAAAVLVWLGHRRAAIAPVIGMLIAAWHPFYFLSNSLTLTVTPLVILVALVWLARDPRARSFPRSWAWFLVPYLFWHLIWPRFIEEHLLSQGVTSYLLITYIPFALVLAWSLIDGRLALSLSIFACVSSIVSLIYTGIVALIDPTENGSADLAGYTNAYGLALIAVILAVGAAGLVRVRRQAAL